MNSNAILANLSEELQIELERILFFWIKFAPDESLGGFFGQISNDNIPDLQANKGSVLNARILWTFSAAYNADAQPKYLHMADHAYLYLRDKFYDPETGGIRWTVNHLGYPADDSNHIYALAFALYGMSEYYRCNSNAAVLDLCVRIFKTIEEKSFDPLHGGYFEAFAANWEPLKNTRLSDHDEDAPKTMNTHLHVAEAYASLYRSWPDELLKQQINGLLLNFQRHIINSQTHHLLPFFDAQWNARGTNISYGHDVEASWLLLECAESIGDETMISQFRNLALKIALAASEGLDDDGGLWYERLSTNDELVEEKHWWPQAEAMVGFFNAWQLSGNSKYLDYTLHNWAFVKEYILDIDKGEWFWGVDRDHQVMAGQDKAGLWKCPYHNGRACLELVSRIKKLNRLSSAGDAQQPNFKN